MTFTALKSADPIRLEKWLSDLEQLPPERKAIGRYQTPDGCMCAMGVSGATHFGAFLHYLGLADEPENEGLFEEITHLNDNTDLTPAEIATTIRKALAQ